MTHSSVRAPGMRLVARVFCSLVFCSVLFAGLPAFGQWRPVYDRAKALDDQGKLVEAAREYKRATELAADELGFDTQSVSAIAQRAGQCEVKLGNNAEAEKWLLIAVRAAVGSDSPQSLGNAVNSLGLVYANQGERAKAHQHYLKAQAAYQRSGDADGAAMVLTNMADNHAVLGEHAQAEALYLKALKFHRGNALKEAEVSYGLGNVYTTIGRRAEARRILEKSLQTFTELAPGSRHQANSMNNLAMLLSEEGEHDRAMELLYGHLAIFEKLWGPRHQEVGVACHNIAVSLAAMDRLVEAEAMYQKALAINLATTGPESVAVGWDLVHLSSTQSLMGRVDKAKENLERGMALLEKGLGRDSPELVSALKAQAQHYSKTDEREKALAIFERAFEIRRKVGGDEHPKTIDAANDLGMTYYGLNEMEKAEATFRRALTIALKALPPDHPTTANLEMNLANSLKYLNRLEESAEHMQRSLQINLALRGPDAPSTCLARLNLSLTMRSLGRWPEAAQLCDESRRGVRRHVARILPIMSEPAQLAYLGDAHSRDLQMAVSLGLHRPDDSQMTAKSAEWLLNGKAIAQEVLTEQTLLLRDAGSPAAASDAQSLLDVRRALAALAQSPAATPAEQARRLKALGDREEALAKRVAQSSNRTWRDPWVTLDEVRAQIPPDAVLVEFFHLWPYDVKTSRHALDAHYAAWVIPPAGAGEVRVIDLGLAEPIHKAIDACRKGITDSRAAIVDEGEAGAEALLKKELTALAKLVIHPLEAHLGKQERWLISPDGNLWLAPWAALPLTDGAYLVEKHTPVVLVTGRDLLPSRPREASGNPGLLLADPDFDLASTARPQTGGKTGGSRSPSGLRSGWQRLPGTAEECRQITTKLTAFAQQEPAVLTGDKATEAAFVDVYQPRVVVLATHGFFVEPAEPKEGQPSAAPENPLLRCGLALAGANQIGKRPAATHDGVLTGLEIVGVDLRGTELVVLSACETGLGDVKSGVGIAGLRQAFQLAGAQAVVSTLWKIPDQETAQLMTAFWQSLADGKDKAAALTEAQRSLIAAHRKQDEKAAHPLYWAAFTLTGSWQPMKVGAARQRPPRAAPAPQVVVVSPAAEIMDGAKQVAKVAQGDRLTVAEKRGEWYLVRVPGMDKNGWILGRHVEALGE